MRVRQGRVAWAVSAVCLVASLASLAIGFWRHATVDRSVVLALGRAMDAALPPWEYDHDWMRFAGLVVEPLCQPPPSFRTVASTARTVAKCHVETSPDGRARVVATLRKDLTFGADRRRGTPQLVREALEALACRAATRRGGSCDPKQPEANAKRAHLLWANIDDTEGEGVVRLSVASNKTGELLWRSLSLTPVALDDGKGWPEGSGPFFVFDGWQRPSESAPTRLATPPLDAEHPAEKAARSRPVSGSPEPPFAVPASLRRHLRDEIVLRRRNASDSGGLDEIVLLGFNWPGGQTESNAADVLGKALRNALDAQTIHGALQLESPQGRAIDLPAPGAHHPEPSVPWVKDSTPPAAVLVAAIRVAEGRAFSGATGDACMARVRDALQRVARDPTFLNNINAYPAVQPLPPGSEPVLFQPCSPDDGGALRRDPTPAAAAVPTPSPDDPCAGRTVVLLTNDNWAEAAEKLKQALGERDSKVADHVEIEAKTPNEEADVRRAGQYDISLLALQDQFVPPAYFLWDNLPGANWFSDIAEPLRALARTEAAGQSVRKEIATFLSQTLGHRLIALGQPQSYDFRNVRLRGLQPRSSFLDPDLLDLERRVSYGWFWLGGLLFVPAVFVTIWQNLRNRRTEGLRRLQEQQAQFFHHQISSPLSAIMGHADRLKKRGIEPADAILAEARAAHELVDRAEWVLKPKGLRDLVHGGRTEDLVADVLEPAARAAKDRARTQGAKKRIVDVKGLSRTSPLRMSPTAARFVVENLLDNALKYRTGDSYQVEIETRLDDGAVTCIVSDYGMGFRRRRDVWRLFRLGFRTPGAKKREVAGSGLGLYLCRQILKHAGGSIRLARRSNPTQFVITFPLAAEPADKGGRA